MPTFSYSRRLNCLLESDDGHMSAINGPDNIGNCTERKESCFDRSEVVWEIDELIYLKCR